MAELDINGSYQIVANQENLTYESEDESLAHVDETGLVTAKNSGKVVINVENEYGDKVVFEVIVRGSLTTPVTTTTTSSATSTKPITTTTTTKSTISSTTTTQITTSTTTTSNVTTTTKSTISSTTTTQITTSSITTSLTTSISYETQNYVLKVESADDNSVTIVGCYVFASEDIVIPEQIGDLDVTSIGNGAFENHDSIKSVIIPESVVSIGENAFAGCSDLVSITILNPDCEIYNSYLTISNGMSDDENVGYIGVIIGYENSTAQKYAEEYGYRFERISTPAVTTTTTCISSVTTSTTTTTIINDKPTTSSSTTTNTSKNDAQVTTVTTTTPILSTTLSLGDINSDGAVDALDASMILIEYSMRATGQATILSNEQRKAADLNGDGAVDALDASMVLIYYSYKATGGIETIENFLK